MAEGIDAIEKKDIFIDCKNASIESIESITYGTGYRGIDADLEDNTLNYSHQNATQLTGMIVYESPNQKNKTYSLIGIIILVLGGAIFLVYRAYKKSRRINRTV